MISDAALREFKEVWLKEFGFEIPDEVAIGEAVAVLTMVNATYRPIKQEWVDEYENQYGNNTEPNKASHDSEEAR